mmetsp:Transcript_11648/g.33512  ORF Transcript_11648/g.33512 Transcript_11648/m.33512 type:complete len:555 (-) Transcript_11648:2375-4039(-)
MNTTDSIIADGDGKSSESSQGESDIDENADTEDFCTLAVTGTNLTYQAIFLCNECILDPSIGDGPSSAIPSAESSTQQKQQQQSPLCICEACAVVCHDGGYHDVDYIGMGPSYCDCNRLGNCLLYEKSLQKAKQLGIVAQAAPGKENKSKPPSSLSSSTSFIREAFDIPILQQGTTETSDAELATLLVEQARELIRHTKETHWIDDSVIQNTTDNVGNASNPQKLCLLESLAWSICLSHRERYKHMLPDHGSEEGYGKGGAEWWVQVKDISNTIDEDVDRNRDRNDPPLSSSSIDLHYDKDEALAESFGLGAFPTLSTVTYLTGSSATAAPTIVFDHTYTQDVDDVMYSMFLSRPRIGKHVCFDGRLLHGAPYHPSLLTSSLSSPAKASGNGQSHPAGPVFRVTFLVNIWNDRRPASVRLLEDKIRESILQLPKSELMVEKSDKLLSKAGNVLLMNPLEIPTVSFEELTDLPEGADDRIELPFVSNLGESDDDEDEIGGTVVVTFPPPPTDDSVLVKFGPGLQAYLDYGAEPDDGEQTDHDLDSPTQTQQAVYL